MNFMPILAEAEQQAEVNPVLAQLIMWGPDVYKRQLPACLIP